MKQWWEGIETLPAQDIAEAITAIMNYALKGEVYSGSNLAVMLLMGMVKKQIDENNTRYQEICEKRKKAVESRWQRVSEENNSIQENTNVFKSIQERTDSDSDNDSDSVCDNGIDKKKKRFIKPTKEEIEGYCKEKGYHIDAQQFIDYYDSVGWVIGKSGKKMKSWQSALSTWETRRKDKPQTPTIFEPESDWVRQRREQEERERREFTQRMFEENKKRLNAKKDE